MSTRGSQKRKRVRADDDNSGGSSSSSSLQDEGARTASSQVSNRESNIANVTPKVGMTLEIRDSDYIWSSARLVDVEKDSGSGDIQVTVRCDGWGDKWDEKVPWPSERLARLYTYTKKVKCFLNLLPKARKRKGLPKDLLLNAKKSVRKVYSNLWPCTVQFRMPHPFREGGSDEEQCLRAEQLLKLEANVFVQPYGVSFLPDYIRSSLDEDGGRWFHNQRLRLWKDDPSELGILPKHFDDAFEEARNDSTVPGVLPTKALEEGSLLDDVYRVRTIGGEDTRGVLIPAPGAQRSAPPQKPPKVVNVQAEVAEEDTENDILRPVDLAVPALPPPVRITEPIYPGLVRCKKSKQSVASISSGGNDIFLGSFPTQTQAWNATRMTAQGTSDEAPPADFEAARLADLRAIPIETIVDAAENQRSSSVSNFSLHEWTIQQIQYEVYLGGKSDARKGDNGDTSSLMDHTPQSEATVSDEVARRKKSRPREVDLSARCFIRS